MESLEGLQMALIKRLREKIYKGRPWYNRPRLSAINTLIQIREDLREQNLHDTEDDPLTGNLPPVGKDSPERMGRTVAGTYNDLKFPLMGAADTRFGRNFPLKETRPDTANLMHPNPRVVSNVLMTRDQFQPATILNLLACAWIQFEVHDWFSHGKVDPVNGEFDVPLPPGDQWPAPNMRIPKTEPDAAPSPDPAKRPTFRNKVTHWWDGSQIYGSRPTIAAKVRAMQDGKLKIGDNGILLFDDFTGLDLTAIVDNWWIGLSMLHTLFTLEHNSVAAELKKQNPGWDDDRLFRVARLINAALMAKIHTVEWTPAILPNPLTQTAMRVNWHGIAGEGLQKIIPILDNSEVLGGIVGSKADHHSAPYSLTEEFVAVYRMHPLLRDELDYVSIKTGEPVRKYELTEVAGKATRQITEATDFTDWFYSFGLMHPGAVCLHNYPRHLQLLKKDDGTFFDMAAVDIIRDRERGVPRYNKFREMLRMPRVESFATMTSNAEWAKQLEEVYGDVDQVDLMTGLYAEPLPPGFGFSDTAFRIFVLMASRRLKSDRFFTDDYKDDYYTDFGLDYIKKNTMKTVLLRHYPSLAPALDGIENAFQPWKRVK